MVYFNMRAQQGVETVDELDRRNFKSFREFAAEKRRLVREYRVAGMEVYTSSRCTAEWNQNLLGVEL